MRDIGLRIFFSKLQLWHWANKETVVHHKTLLKFIWFVFLKSSYIHSIYTEARDLTNVWGSNREKGESSDRASCWNKNRSCFRKMKEPGWGCRGTESTATAEICEHLLSSSRIFTPYEDVFSYPNSSKFSKFSITSTSHQNIKYSKWLMHGVLNVVK